MNLWKVAESSQSAANHDFELVETNSNESPKDLTNNGKAQENATFPKSENDAESLRVWVEVCKLNSAKRIHYSSRSGLMKWIENHLDQSSFKKIGRRNWVDYNAFRAAWLLDRKKELPTLEDLMRGL